MESVLGRFKNLIILMIVLFLQVLGLAVQVKKSSTDAQSTRLIRIWVVGAITPLERGLVWIQNSTSGVWHNYFYLRGVRAENRDLKDQIEQMRLEQIRLSQDAAQAHRLQALLAFKEQFIQKTVAAQVIGSSGSDLSRSVYIDKGSDDGIKPDLAVITSEGVVGKVLRVYPSTSLVLLINDQSSGVGAIVEKSRLQGVIRGTPNGEVTLERIMSDEQVSAGDVVQTSGGDQIFPKGMPIGTVTKVANGKELFLSIKIKPTANLSKLEEVLVVVQKQERQAVAEDTGRVRAADILAQRLPSVPEKPATPQPGTTTTQKTTQTGSTQPGSAQTGSPQTGSSPATQAGTTPAGTAPKQQSAATVKPNSQPTGTKPASTASTQLIDISNPATGAAKTAVPKPATATKPQTKPETQPPAAEDTPD